MPRQWLGEERSHWDYVCGKTFLGSSRIWGWSGLEKLVTCSTWVSGPSPPFCPWGLGGSHPTNVCKCFEVFLQDVSYEQRKESTAGPGASGVRYYPGIHVVTEWVLPASLLPELAHQEIPVPGPLVDGRQMGRGSGLFCSVARRASAARQSLFLSSGSLPHLTQEKAESR